MLRKNLIVLIVVSFSAGLFASVPIANPSFEDPVIDPQTNPFLAVPNIPYWIEQDVDTESSSNTGIFLNLPYDSLSYITNADQYQLVFLGSQQGNAILQDLNAYYTIGKKYRLTIGVCVSQRYAPSPENTLDLAMYFIDNGVRSDIASTQIPVTGLTATQLVDFSLVLPEVQDANVWANKQIGIAIRSIGPAAGFWDIDNVRLNDFSVFPDFAGEPIVNFVDFAKLASEWMFCSSVTTDLTGDGCVNYNDLIIFSEHWLEYIPN